MVYINMVKEKKIGFVHAVKLNMAMKIINLLVHNNS